MKRTLLLAALLLAATTVLAGERAVTVELRSGERIDGTLVALKDGVLEVRVGEQVRRIADDQLRRIEFDADRAPAADASKDPAGPEIDVDVEEQPLRDVIADIASRSGRTILAEPGIQEKTSIVLRKIPWRDAVDVLAKMARCEVVRLQGGTLVVRKIPRVTLALRETAVRDVLESVGALAGRSVVAAPDLTEKVSVDWKEVLWIDAVEQLVRSAKLHAARSGEVVVVTRDPVAWGDSDLHAADAWRFTEATAARKEVAERVDLAAKDTDLRDVCDDIGRAVGRNIIVEPEIHLNVTLSVKQAPWRDVLTFLVHANGLSLEAHGSIYVVTQAPDVSVRVRGAAAADLVRMLGSYAGLNVVVAPGVTGRVGRLDVRRMHWRDLLNVVAIANGLTVEVVKEGTVTVGVDEKVRARLVKTVPHFDPATVTTSDGKETTVDLRAIVVDPRPESQNRVIIGSSILAEYDELLDAKGRKVLRLGKVEEGKVRVRLPDSGLEATVELP